MFSTLTAARAECVVAKREARLLQAPEAPVVLLRRHWAADAPQTRIAEAVARHNQYLGVRLPYTPLHHLLTAELGFPIVAADGSRPGEPACTDEREALDRLAGIADVLLTHSRPIARHAYA
jgi:hydrogenase maturation protein HypF